MLTLPGLNGGMPSLKSFDKVRREHNIRAYYKLVGNYHKAQQLAHLRRMKVLGNAK